MPKHKKKFIDKKNAITYQLIHRSQKDPLQADEDASKMVLVTGDEMDEAKRRERLTTYGIYYDDDYDYEQHLRDVDDLNKMEPDRDVEELFRVGATAKSKNSLPAEVLPSAQEEEIGMLELAAPVSGPRVDWDPDIVAALDSDNDEPIDEDFEDDFIAIANQSGDEEEWEEPSSDKLGDRQRQWIQDQMVDGAIAFDPAVHSQLHTFSSDKPYTGDEDDLSSNFSGDDEEDDEVGSLQSFSDDDNKTRFTNYSMSSSVIRRNEGLTLIDDKFEQLYAEYDEEEIGALDHEEIDGKVSTTGPMMEYLLKQFEKQQVKESLPGPLDQKETIEVVSDLESSEDEHEELTKVVVDEGVANKWDCESILSTYSNLYNHPKVIEEPWRKSNKIELTKKLGIPKESIQPKGLTRKQLQELEKEQAVDTVKAAPVRRKGETAEEKKQRKALVKEERKERRVEKKNTKLAFRHEAASQKKQQISQANTSTGQKIL